MNGQASNTSEQTSTTVGKWVIRVLQVVGQLLQITRRVQLILQVI